MASTNEMGTIAQLLRRIFDTILPPNPIESISTEQFLNKTKNAQRVPPVVLHDWAFAPLHYKDPLVRLAIRSLKYKESVQAAKLLACSMHPLVLEYISDESLFNSAEKIMLIPIPLAGRRLRERGYNQALMLAQELEKMFSPDDFKVADNVLIRTKDTLSQTKIQSREDRFKNIAGCFVVQKPEQVKKKLIVLIDDVITTGATVSEARRVLLDASSSDVTAIVAAH